MCAPPVAARRGGSYAVHSRCGLVSSLGVGPCEQLHHGRVYSHPARHCYCDGAGQFHSGKKNNLIDIKIGDLL